MRRMTSCPSTSGSPTGASTGLPHESLTPETHHAPAWMHRIPGLCSTFGMIIVNLIDKQRLLSDYDDSPSSFGGSVAWKARLFLFLGFALMAGGLAGSVTVLVLKYVIPDWHYEGVVYWGIANVLQSILVMMRCAELQVTSIPPRMSDQCWSHSACVLWIAQNSDQDYEYNLSL